MDLGRNDVLGELAGDAELEEDVVGTDHEIELRCEFADLVCAADIAGEFLDRLDVAEFVEFREHARYKIDLRVDRIVVRDDREADGRDFLVVLQHGTVVAAVRVRR